MVLFRSEYFNLSQHHFLFVEIEFSGFTRKLVLTLWTRHHELALPSWHTHHGFALWAFDIFMHLRLFSPHFEARGEPVGSPVERAEKNRELVVFEPSLLHVPGQDPEEGIPEGQVPGEHQKFQIGRLSYQAQGQ